MKPLKINTNLGKEASVYTLKLESQDNSLIGKILRKIYEGFKKRLR